MAELLLRMRGTGRFVKAGDWRDPLHCRQAEIYLYENA